MATHNVDVEKDSMSATARFMIPSSASSAPNHANANDSIKHTPLQLFQLLVGIHTPLTSIPTGLDTDRANEAKWWWQPRPGNIGLYQRAKQEERTSRIKYLCTSIIGNALYMLQVLLAATFTALSAYKDSSPVTLTVLGALNTVVAGFLAWQKGQGVPQRYRKAQDQYQAIILDIEMTERSFVDIDHNDGDRDVKLDPRVEMARLQKSYEAAKAEQEANYPDLYVNTGAAGANGAKELMKQLENAKTETAKVQSEIMARIEVLVEKIGDKALTRIEHTVPSAVNA